MSCTVNDVVVVNGLVIVGRLPRAVLF
jgi:hypothetical protein